MTRFTNTYRMQTENNEFTLLGVFTLYTSEITSNWNWNEQTLAQYHASLLYTIIPCIDDHNQRPIQLYTPEYMDSVIKRIEELGHERYENGYTPDTLNRFRHIMAVTVRTAIAHLLCPDVWREKPNTAIGSKQRRSSAKPVRYFLPDDELRIIRYITENAYHYGEMRGLYIMMCTRSRANEAAGLTWEMIRPNEDDPELLTISIMQTTQLKSVDTKLGGKTANAPRQITLTADQSAFIRDLRSRLEERWVKKGGDISAFCKSRVATRKNKLWEPCRARHLSDAANAMFAELNLSDTLAVISRGLAKEALEYTENPDFWETPPETSATCYTLRRAAATFDRVLGIDMEDRQYLMGHAVSNATYPHVFRDARHQSVLAQKAADRPGLNKIQTPVSRLDEALTLRGAYHDTVLANYDGGRIIGMISTEEPGDQLRLVIHSAGPCKLIVKSNVQDPPDEYTWKINVKRRLYEMYETALEEEGGK